MYLQLTIYTRITTSSLLVIRIFQFCKYMFETHNLYGKLQVACKSIRVMKMISSYFLSFCNSSMALAKGSGTTAMSLGCKGNRTFAGLPDQEMYFVVPGEHWAAVGAQLETIAMANRTMGQYYEGKKAQFPIL